MAATIGFCTLPNSLPNSSTHPSVFLVPHVTRFATEHLSSINLLLNNYDADRRVPVVRLFISTHSLTRWTVLGSQYNCLPNNLLSPPPMHWKVFRGILGDFSTPTPPRCHMNPSQIPFFSLLLSISVSWSVGFRFVDSSWVG